MRVKTFDEVQKEVGHSLICLIIEQFIEKDASRLMFFRILWW